MSRTFIYSFTPPSLGPAPDATIELNVCEIEDAGIREALQTPAATPRRSLCVAPAGRRLDQR